MKSFLLLLLIPLSVQALEVDEKLTVRVIRTSETKKTMMINRGTEDGIVEGDHARFMVTAGIVARAVAVKVSPTRSVWSVYRLVNADFILNDSVMTLKITPAVKITKDESQTLVQEDTPSKVTGDPTQLGIPLADGAQDVTPQDDALSNADLKALEEPAAVSMTEKNWEVIGLLNISSLSAKTKVNDGDDSFNNSSAYHHIGLGAEYYPRREREWYSRFSLHGEMNLMRLNSQAYNGSTSSTDVTEFAGGVNWHPTKLPSLANAFIPYLNFSLGIGTVKSDFNPGLITDITEYSASGSSTSFGFGFGYKYYTSSGFGARMLFDYYFRTEKYNEDDQRRSFNRTVAGPRLMVALSYRF